MNIPKAIRFAALAATCAFLTMLAGCALIQANTAAGKAFNLGIEIPVSLYIEKAGPDAASRLARATKIKAIADEIGQAASGTITVAQLSAWLIGQTGKLDPALALLITGPDGLVSVLQPYLDQKVNAGVLSAAAGASVAIIVTDIDQACALYGAK